ncbi:hypothetical protein [Streptomyces bikiniensis]|uniref:hypothetical protein n=1 Tax=Streptomyces bikiniensis TaxID=1896 RepID=UPI0004BFC18B
MPGPATCAEAASGNGRKTSRDPRRTATPAHERNSGEQRPRRPRPGTTGRQRNRPRPRTPLYAAAFSFARLAGEDLRRCALHGAVAVAVAGAYACTVPATGSDAIERVTLLDAVAELTADRPASGPGRAG